MSGGDRTGFAFVNREMSARPTLRVTSSGSSPFVRPGVTRGLKESAIHMLNPRFASRFAPIVGFIVVLFKTASAENPNSD